MRLRLERVEQPAEVVRPVDRRDDEIEADARRSRHRRRLPSAPAVAIARSFRRPRRPRRRGDDRRGGHAACSARRSCDLELVVVDDGSIDGTPATSLAALDATRRSAVVRNDGRSASRAR